MGAGAYMMLEIVEPAVTFIQIVKAALIPAILYYLSLFLIVHFYAKRAGANAETIKVPKDRGRPRQRSYCSTGLVLAPECSLSRSERYRLRGPPR